MGLKKSNSEAKVRKSRQMYKFVKCLAFARVKKNNDYVGIFGYLNYVEDCQCCLPHQPLPLYLNEMVKRMA